MTDFLSYSALILLGAGCMMFIGNSKTSKLWTWLLLSLSMMLCIIYDIMTQNGFGLVIGIIAFVLDFRLFRKALREYNKERSMKNKKANFFKDLEELQYNRNKVKTKFKK